MDQATKLLFLIPLIPFIGAAINLLLGRRLARGTIHTVAVMSVLASFVIAAYLIAGPLWKAFDAWRAAGESAPEVLSGLHQSLYTWIEVGSLKIELAFRLDTLSAVMVLVITFVGTLIHIFSIGYMEHEPRYSTYFG